MASSSRLAQPRRRRSSDAVRWKYGILFATDATRMHEVRQALLCLEDARVRLPVAVQCYPPNPGCQVHLPSNLSFSVDVQKEEDLLDKHLRPNKGGRMHKAVAVYHSPFRYTLFMDTDTCVLSPRLREMFAPLKDFDFVSVWECCAEVHGTSLTYGWGWEPNTGVFALRRSARQLMMDWYHLFMASREHYEKTGSKDQQAMLDQLRLNKSYSFFPMPATFNFRRFTMPFAGSGSGRLHDGVVVLHPTHSQMKMRSSSRGNASKQIEQIASWFAKDITSSARRGRGEAGAVDMDSESSSNSRVAVGE